MAQPSLQCQESSCDYCKVNQPVITLRGCQALDRVLWETPFSSMWPHSWQKSHPVMGLHLNSIQQEYADWDIHPPAIVPLLISSNRTFSIWAFHRSHSEERTSRSQLKFLKEMAFSDLCRLGLPLMIIRSFFLLIEAKVKASNSLFVLSTVSPTKIYWATESSHSSD